MTHADPQGMTTLPSAKHETISSPPQVHQDA